MRAPRATAKALPGAIEESRGQNAENGKSAESIQKNAESEESLGQNTDSGKHAESMKKNAESEESLRQNAESGKNTRSKANNAEGEKILGHTAEEAKIKKTPKKIVKNAQHFPFLDGKSLTTSDASRPQPPAPSGLAR